MVGDQDRGVNHDNSPETMFSVRQGKKTWPLGISDINGKNKIVLPARYCIQISREMS